MRSRERWEYLARAPRVACDLALRGCYRFTYDQMPMTVRGLSWAARANMARASLNLVHRRPHAWSWPLHMQIEIASLCNLRCPVCPLGNGDLTRAPQFMDVNVFERLMTEVGPYLLVTSLWAWGEPLLHPQLDRILEIAGRYPGAALLSTNGQNLDRPSVQQALRNHPPAYLIVAIDGLTDETNSRYRQGARLAPAIEGVRALAAWKARSGSRLPILNFRFLVMRHNEHELPRVHQFAEDLGFDMVSIRSLSIIDSPERPHRELIPSIGPFRAYDYRDGERLRRTDFICQHAFSFPTVLADGTVVACEQDFNGVNPYGVFSREHSFASIWFGAEAARIRRIIRDHPAEYSACRNCPYADRDTSSCSVEGYLLRPENS